jgi:glutathione synthase/RimK-type ligase-like ATP-grasp enzyme
MSRTQIIGMTTDTEWAIWTASRALTHRDHYMNDASIYLRMGSTEAARTCVQAARDCNREYLKHVAEYRALKAAEMPKRKRA